MIYSFMHPGSGLGNMLHRYVAMRVLSLEKGYEFSVINPTIFKGKSFMHLDMGNHNDVGFHIEEPSGKLIAVVKELKVWQEWDKHTYDPNFNFVEDNTIIDGNFEDERYFGDYLPKIDEWLKVKEWNIPEDVCVIGFRGGEYYAIPDLGLPKEYFERAILEMRKINPNMRFEVHTDDNRLAKDMFARKYDFPVTQDINLNWTAMRYAKYAIIANSSFYVLPRLLNGGLTIAPKYFNRYNTKKWDYPQFYYKKFTYI